MKFGIAVKTQKGVASGVLNNKIQKRWKNLLTFKRGDVKMKAKRTVISIMLAAFLLITPVSAISESVDLIDTDAPISTYAASTVGGWLDSVSTTEIAGWAWNSATPNSPINVHVYVINTTLNREWSYAVAADIYRSDLAAAGYGNGCHGFSYLINWYNYPAGDYIIRVYGVDGITNPQLSGCPKSFKIESPRGNVDYLNSDGIGGWMYKPIAPDASIQAHIYIRRMNGEVLSNIVCDANQHRDDLQALGYGSGNHGFSANINWIDYPEEKLQVTVYAVDGTGYHPSIFTREYDNRSPIHLLYTVDGDGINRGIWMNETTFQNCRNIGCINVNKNEATNENIIRYAFGNSSYCAISTHGCETAIFAYKNGESISFNLSDVYEIPNGYLNRTRCILIDACSAAKGGADNPDNFVNRLYAKGAGAVVGFRETTYCVLPSGVGGSYGGSQLWSDSFTRCLGEGKTIKDAARIALEEVKAEDQTKTYGCDSYYIAGNKNQVVKH